MPRRAVDPALAELLPEGPSCTVKDAASLLSMPTSEVYQAVHAGDLRGHRVGKRGIRIYVRSIAEYQESRSIAPRRQRTSSPSKPVAASEVPTKAPSSNHREALAFLHGLGVIGQPSGRR